MYFDFGDGHPDLERLPPALSVREGIMLAVITHLLLVIAVLVVPELPWYKAMVQAAEEARAQAVVQRPPPEQRRFVFVQPRVDFEAKQPPPRAELSDINRKSQAPRLAPTPSNPLPFSRGNSSERVESAPEERARGVETEIPPNTEPPKPQPQEQIAKVLPPAQTGLRRDTEISRPAPGRLGDALRNLERYVQNQTFNNPQGGAHDPGSTIQFDTKGVEFGPWVRRFVAQVRRNWFIPTAAMNFRGHVVIQFNVHKNGLITDVNVAQPSSIDAFNRAAYQAIVGSSPTEPLPPEYPDPMAFFTVTFYYNEQPPG